MPTTNEETYAKLKEQIKILCRKVVQLKPELEEWVKKNFINSWEDGEEE